MCNKGMKGAIGSIGILKNWTPEATEKEMELLNLRNDFINVCHQYAIDLKLDISLDDIDNAFDGVDALVTKFQSKFYDLYKQQGLV